MRNRDLAARNRHRAARNHHRAARNFYINAPNRHFALPDRRFASSKRHFAPLKCHFALPNRWMNARERFFAVRGFDVNALDGCSAAAFGDLFLPDALFLPSRANLFLPAVEMPLPRAAAVARFLTESTLC